MNINTIHTYRRQLIRSEVLISQEATKSQTIGKGKHAGTVTMQRSDMQSDEALVSTT